jgi:large subunit ribosomal protein L25
VTFEIQGEARQGTGRAANRLLRDSGRVPAIVYGGGKDPQSVSLDQNSLFHQMEQESFYTSILALKVGADVHSVVVKDVQRHPARLYVVHLDFQRIVDDEELTLHVPLHFLNEATATGVKEQGGQIEHTMTDIEISCLPKDLPEFVEVDLAKLELNEIFHLSDVQLPAGVTSVALAHGQDLPVASIHPPRQQEVDEPTEQAEESAEPKAAEADED